MKVITGVFVTLLSMNNSFAEENNTDSLIDPMEICLISGLPTANMEYEVIRKIKIGKHSYGGVTDILPPFAEKAQRLGGNGVINYVGSQRFGFWPWRFIRPVVRGNVVKLKMDSSQTCKDIGGATVKEVIATNKEPHKI